MADMTDLFYICCGAILGATARYGLSAWLSLHLGAIFPWGTLAVNILGCFLIGLATFKASADMRVKLFLITGFLGSFTTFSAFSLETINLIKNGKILNAGIYVAVSVILSLAAVLTGMQVSKK